MYQKGIVKNILKHSIIYINSRKCNFDVSDDRNDRNSILNPKL